MDAHLISLKIGQLNIPKGVIDGYEAFNGCEADRVFIDIQHIDGAPEDDYGPYENADPSGWQFVDQSQKYVSSLPSSPA